MEPMNQAQRVAFLIYQDIDLAINNLRRAQKRLDFLSQTFLPDLKEDKLFPLSYLYDEIDFLKKQEDKENEK
ncbi:MAG: hypothetical protein IJN96_07840 [Clostridia bacterium]|nr:hypothetical protein [Clostridia bacterium]